MVSYCRRGAGLDIVTSASPDTVCKLTRPLASAILTAPFTVSSFTSPARSTVTWPFTASTSTSPYEPPSLMLPLVVLIWTLEPVGIPILIGPPQLPGQSTSTSTSSPSTDIATPPPGQVALTSPVAAAVTSKP